MNTLSQFQIMILVYSNIYYMMINVMNDARVSFQDKPYLGCRIYFKNCNRIPFFIGLNFFSVYIYFWPRCVACGISVPRRGIEPGPRQ